LRLGRALLLRSSFISSHRKDPKQMTPKRPRVTPAMAAGVTDNLWEMDDLVAMLEQWELANFKPEYQFVVRKYDMQ
jgi:hypothetical protein